MLENSKPGPPLPLPATVPVLVMSALMALETALASTVSLPPPEPSLIRSPADFASTMYRSLPAAPDREFCPPPPASTSLLPPLLRVSLPPLPYKAELPAKAVASRVSFWSEPTSKALSMALMFSLAKPLMLRPVSVRPMVTVPVKPSITATSLSVPAPPLYSPPPEASGAAA